MIRPRAALGLAVLLVISTAFAAPAGVDPARGRRADWWPEGRRPPYHALDAARWADSHAVLLAGAMFVTGPDKTADSVATSLPGILRGAPVGQGGWLLVQFGSETPPADRVALLQRHGALVADAIANNVRLARVPAAEVAGLAAEKDVLWVGRLHPAFKLSPSLGATLPGKPPQDAEGGPWRLTLVLAEDADLGAVAGFARGLGAEIVEARPGVMKIETLDTDSLVQFARRDDILFVEETPETVLYNDQDRWVLQSDIPGNYSIHDHGVRAAGQIVALMDTGLDTTHCCFSAPGKVVDYRAWGGGVLGDECNPNHGTHTSGTAVCSNGGDHDGLAPDANLIMQDIGKPAFCANVYPPSPLSSAWSDALARGARVHSNSWGGGSDAYSFDSAAINQFMWDNQDFLIVYAAGNDGPSARTLGFYSNAKNSVTVGASGNGTNDETLPYYSSRGPAGDGRLLPDLTAPGDGVSSAHNQSGCGWVTESGTSMATPGVAGSAALVRDYYVRGFYPGGAANVNSQFQPSAALVKATLLLSTRNMIGSGASGNRPDNSQGFGRVTLDDALWFVGDPTDQRLVILDDRNSATGFTTVGQVDQFTIHTQSTAPVKAMLTWTDAAGSPLSSKELVNNLDLEVDAPGGAVYGGNQGFSGGWTVTPSSVRDHVNNKEAVFLQAGPAGDYTIKVTAYALGNVQSHPQDYALLVTAATTPTCTAAPPTGVGNTVTQVKQATDVLATWADRGADHYIVYRGETPNFFGGGTSPYQGDVHDQDLGTPGVQWRDIGVNGDGTSHYYLYASANQCGDVAP